MNPDKITIVSGEPRSGTSMMMQTLKELGMPVTGSSDQLKDRLKHYKDDQGNWLPEHVDKRESIERRAKQSEMMNPIGYYETEFVSRGVRGVEAEEYRGKVMKIITSGVPERHGPNGSVGTSIDLIDKIILCVRNPKNIAVSQKNLINEKLLVAGNEGDWIYHNDAPPSPLAYIGRSSLFINWLLENMEMREKIHVVEYEDMHSNPKEEIYKIVDFLGISPTEDQFNSAVSNVKPQLKRSEAFDQWPDKFKEDGELAMQIYGAIKSLSEDDMTCISSIIKSKQMERELERSKWVDDNEGMGTWATVDAELYRSIMANKKNLRDNLKRVSSGNDCTKCRYHTTSDKEYTTKRPMDLGDLTRSLVLCERDRDYRTVEQCHQCYSIGWNLNGKPVPPARVKEIK